MKQQLFKTSPVKRIMIYLFSIVLTFVLTSIFLMGERFTNIYWAINILIFAVCFLFIIFESDITIICDEVSCTVKKKRFWQTSGESSGFQWNEVSETEFYADVEANRKFYVEINGEKRELLTVHFSHDDFDYFIRTVNYATPHLSYFWEKQNGWVSNNFEGRRYKKAAR
ncbi:MAG: hypothetical protein ACR2MD_17780 [Aridibacter sp.]